MAMTDREPDQEWMLRGACVGNDPELWFPTRGEDSEPAKEICRVCPVRLPCQDFGMTQKHGIWGGLSERQRRRMRRARRGALPAARSDDVTSIDDWR